MGNVGAMQVARNDADPGRGGLASTHRSSVPLSSLPRDPAHTDNRQPTTRTLPGAFHLGQALLQRFQLLAGTPQHQALHLEFLAGDQIQP